MYVYVGLGDQSLLTRDWSSYPVQWNPPGWGSCSVPLEDLPIPNVRIATLLGIKPGGSIPLHTDKPNVENNIDESLVRYHLVLATNNHCWSYHDGTWQQLGAGTCWTMDPTKDHASVNWGSTPRWHLILDIVKETS